MRELLDEPRGMALDIIELRAYARAKSALEQAKNSKDIPDDPMIERVWEVQHEIARRRKGESQ